MARLGGDRIRFLDLNVDLEKLAGNIEVYLKEKNYEVTCSRDKTEPATWFSIQATKINLIRKAVGMRRSIAITIKGEPNFFDISWSTGQFKKNFFYTLPYVVTVIGAVIPIAAVNSYIRSELKVSKFIDEQARSLKNTGGFSH